ncbi:MAG: gliding motility protein GldL [Flavobacteriales bacterium]|nr:gliding motility protein GldL [Flavobacteriales bacterium]
MGLLGEKATAMLYGLGAAVVIVGALFKLMHWPGASAMLIVGLSTEAIIFGLSAFEPLPVHYHWENVYPELVDHVGEAPAKGAKGHGAKTEEAVDAEGQLSKKLDNLLKEAKIDAALMESLGASIKNFESAAKSISPTIDSVGATKKYSEEMSLAASQMESLNSLYKIQLESASRNAQINQEVAENAGKLKDQMASLSTNLSSLNGVYGGMLSAMGVKNS